MLLEIERRADGTINSTDKTNHTEKEYYNKFNEKGIINFIKFQGNYFFYR